MNRELILPDDFAEYEWEVTAKGVFTDGMVRVGERRLAVSFYEPKRLAQDVEEDLTSGRAFCVARLFVVERVTAAAMRSAISSASEETFE